jgi:hypothetical protein
LTFVQEHHAEASRRSGLKAVAGEAHFAKVKSRSDPGRSACGQTLRHGAQDHTAIGLGQKAALGLWAACLEGRCEIQSAEKSIVGDGGRAATQGRMLGQ